MSVPEPELSPTYLSGLRLQGRKVVMVGGGAVAQRRVPALIAAGAVVHVVSPDVTPAIEGLAGAGEITWTARDFDASDLDGAWYVIAATDSHEVNAEVGTAAEARHTFCVRADDAESATAWTPAVGHHDGLTVGVLSDGGAHRNPRRTAGIRDEIVGDLQSGRIAGHTRERVPGVVLIGGGPGDPDLISVAGRRALMEADVVVADRLAPRELLGELSVDTELIDVAKLPRGRSAQQEEINRVIVERALAGKRVARFKGGDNFVFGRGYEEVIACREAGVPVTVIPGLSSPIAVPGLVGIPVTHRGVTHDLTIVSGHLPPEHPDSLVEWRALAQLRGTVVLMMAVENAPAIAAALLSGGRPAGTPVAVVCDGSMPGERTVLSTLESLAADLEANAVKPPAIIVIGDVVAVAHPERYPVRGMSRFVDIADPADPRLADYRDLRDVQLRQSLEAAEGLFLAEGEKVVRRAVEAGFEPRSFLMAPRWLEGLDDVLAQSSAPVYVVSEALAEQVTGFHVHRGALASLHRRPLPSVESVLTEARSVLVLEDLVDHTNVGAVFRCGAAFGFDAVLLAPRCADPLYRRAIKVGMGAVFNLPWTRLPEWYDALPALSSAGFTTVALTLAENATPVEEAVADVDRLALVLGSEGHGLSPRWEQSADRRAIIPMAPGVDSLNVAAAAAVACFASSRR